MQQKVKSLFADRGFWRSALRLAIPIALQNLLLSSFTLVDTVMIGSLGDVPLAAVGMAGQWSWVMNILFFGVNSGASVFLAQYWGVRDVRGIQRTFGLLLVGALAPALLFTGVGLLAPGFVMRLFTKDPVVIEQGCSYLTAACFSYVALALSQAASTLLRSTEEVRLPVAASLCSVLTNALLNYALIFGRFGAPAMGLRGAAIATAIAAWVNVAVLYGAALGVIQRLITGEQGYADLVGGLLAVLVVSMVMVFLMYPMAFRFGLEKARNGFLVVWVALFGGFMLFGSRLEEWAPLEDVIQSMVLHPFPWAGGALLTAIAVMALCYVSSVQIYSKKEF